MLVNTALVVKEIFIDSEGTLDRSISVEIGHDSLFVAGERVSARSSTFVGLVFSLGFFVASLVALRSGLSSSAGTELSVNVVITRSEGVRSAPVLIGIQVTTNKTSVLEEVPST